MSSTSALNTLERTVPFTWDETSLKLMLAFVKKHKAHMKTSGRTFEQKWEDVTKELFNHCNYLNCVKLNGGSVKKHYDRLARIVNDKFSLTTEGSNLSGLPEQASDNDKMIYDLLVERMRLEKDKELSKEKDKQREDTMLTHEKNILEMFISPSGKKRILDGANSGEEESNSEESLKNSSSSRKKSSSIFNLDSNIFEPLREDSRIVDIKVKQLEFELANSIAEAEHKRKIELMKVECEAKKLKNEESANEIQKTVNQLFLQLLKSNNVDLNK
jgi:hypothetical protein